MAEICLDCWNKLNKTNHRANRYIISKDLDFCEECEQYKPVIVRMRMWATISEDIREWISDMRIHTCCSTGGCAGCADVPGCL